jgi:hypothetical protein
MPSAAGAGAGAAGAGALLLSTNRNYEQLLCNIICASTSVLIWPASRMSNVYVSPGGCLTRDPKHDEDPVVVQ